MLGKLLRDDSSQHIRYSTGSARYDEPHGTIWIGLGRRHAGDAEKDDRGEGTAERFHGVLL
jgi:hypothetical protein